MARRTNQYFLFVFLFFMIGSTVLGLLLTKRYGSAFRLVKHHHAVFGIHSHAGHLCKNGESLGEGMLFH